MKSNIIPTCVSLVVRVLTVSMAMLCAVTDTDALIVEGFVTDTRLNRVAGAAIRFISSDETVSAVTDDDGRYSVIIDFTAGVDNERALPDPFLLHQNYPNPFNPTTTISYELLRPAVVRLDIFNILGNKVSTLVDTYQHAGKYSISWNGRNRGGNEVGSGIYFYRLQAGNTHQTLKMLLLDSGGTTDAGDGIRRNGRYFARRAVDNTNNYKDYTISIEHEDYLRFEEDHYRIDTTRLKRIYKEFVIQEHMHIGDYFPLAIGNSWTYTYRQDDLILEETYTIVGSRTIKGNKYFVFDTTPRFFVFPDFTAELPVRSSTAGEHYTSEDGEVLLAWNGSEDFGCFYFGTTDVWPDIDDLTSYPHDEQTPYWSLPVMLNRRITVPPESYVCKKYHAWSTDFEVGKNTHIWFDPDYGPVQFRIYGKTATDFVLERSVIDGIVYGESEVSYDDLSEVLSETLDLGLDSKNIADVGLRNKLFGDEKILVSHNNINHTFLRQLNEEGFLFLDPEGIKEYANTHGDRLYYTFSNVMMQENVVTLSLSLLWITSDDSLHEYLSGGGFSITWEKDGGSWTYTIFDKWIS
ncbi:T9SS type A sorting domain-containing protein [Candidatus Omnitrophota bacterium]